MKKKKSAPEKNLPQDFSTTDVPESDKPSLETPQVSPEPETITSPVEVPEVDKNAELKIESVPEPIETELPEGEKKGVAMFIFGSVFGLLLTAGVATLAYLYLRPSVPTTTTVTTPTPTISTTPSPTTISLEKSRLSFEVLNASGKAGEAGKVQKTLVSLGYTVGTIGNAQQNNNGLQLFLSAGVTDQKDLLLQALQKDFPTIKYAGQFEGGSNTVRLVIGL